MSPSRKDAADTSRPPRAVGELALIERIRERAGDLPPSLGRELRLGIGDDCAILRPREGEELVVTTDLTLEGRHFRRDWHTSESAGHRTLARGLSDLAAMGARPVAAFLSLALPRSRAADTAWVDGFLDGLMRLAARVRVPLAGGDTAGAPGDHVLADIVLLGAVPAGRALRRDGARPGDRIFCTGALGGAAAELLALAEARTSAEGRTMPPPTAAEAVAGEHPQLFPEPRLAAGQLLAKRGLANAAIDLSDGLSTDLRHLCEASGVAAEVDVRLLPLHPQAVARGRAEALRLALNGGEDYELLFTAPAATRMPRRLGGVAITAIGRIVRTAPGLATVMQLCDDGSRIELLAAGWEHLS